jgi:hypothetical protein
MIGLSFLRSGAGTELLIGQLTLSSRSTVRYNNRPTSRSVIVSGA